ncbi:hypothetical protein [Lachnospira pectinoschiza]|uniref:Uncharacterized protein n=1 Tax=Lachnospira pectinoschiza TaxID=28052 RepID=A0A1G9U335_9FIRM|nr:hypothetical protein [Lachnospira pectinoschiza]SDM54326.1 hypothetical protein SAMN05216544_0593 [Lachnospira pectinoschiza]
MENMKYKIYLYELKYNIDINKWELEKNNGESYIEKVYSDPFEASYICDELINAFYDMDKLAPRAKEPVVIPEIRVYKGKTMFRKFHWRMLHKFFYNSEAQYEDMRFISVFDILVMNNKHIDLDCNSIKVDEYEISWGDKLFVVNGENMQINEFD